MSVVRAFALGVAVLVLASPPAGAWTLAPVTEALQSPPVEPEPDPPPVETESFRGRVVAPVFVNGAGPYRFIVDTGANRSGVSRRLAEKLGLAVVGRGELHAVTGVKMTDMAAVGEVRSGAMVMSASELPILDGAVLGGADGMLGMDGMDDKRILIDLDNDTLAITESRRREGGRDWATLDASLRFGNLVVADGRVGDIAVKVVIDTGAPSSLANVALRSEIAAGRGVVRRRSPSGGLSGTRIISAASPIVVGDAIVLPSLKLGTLEVSNTVVVVADFYIFSLWDLLDQPAIVLGMDVLGQTRAVAIDYRRKEVRLRLPPGF